MSIKIDIIVTTGNNIDGYEISDVLGVVRGIVVRATSLGAGLLGGLKSLVGGNISEFESVCDKAREEAYVRLIQHAKKNGADAIIGMRFDATEFYQGVTEVLAYGTAVKLKKP